MVKVLGIDTSTTGCSVAVIDGEVCLAQEAKTMIRGQSEELTPMIRRVIDSSGCDFADLDAISVTRGPGAFTGLRIGLAAARALALTSNVPCIGLSSFDVLFEQARRQPETQGADILVAIESKRDEPYVAAYNIDGSESLSPSVAELDAIADWQKGRDRVCIAGDAAERTVDLLSSRAGSVQVLQTVKLIDAGVLAQRALLYIGAPEKAPPNPIYLRPPDVTMPNKKD